MVPDMRGPERVAKTWEYDSSRVRVVERATKTRDYDLLRIRVGQKEPPRTGNTI